MIALRRWRQALRSELVTGDSPDFFARIRKGLPETCGW
jgi:hypothetical protein